MPEQIRLKVSGITKAFFKYLCVIYFIVLKLIVILIKVGGVTPQQMAVYEEFARNIPGFLPHSERDQLCFITKPSTVKINLVLKYMYRLMAASFLYLLFLRSIVQMIYRYMTNWPPSWKIIVSCA